MAIEEFFSIIDYIVDGPQTQEAVISAFADIQRQWVAPYPGYLSAQFLASADGTRVKCIVRWASEADFAHFEDVSDTKGRSEAIQQALRGLSCTAERRSFKLVRVIDPQTGPGAYQPDEACGLPRGNGRATS